MGTPRNMNAKKPQNRRGTRLEIRELIQPPISNAGAVTIALAGIYDLGMDAPNVYCVDPEAFGFDQVYVIRFCESEPVCGSDGNPEGAACQRGSSALTPGGRWKVTARFVFPTTY